MVNKIFAITRYAVKQRAAELRIYLLFLMMILFIWNDLTAVSNFAGEMAVRTSPLIYPFLASDPVKQLILLAGVIFLFSDAPFINKCQPYVVIRSSRFTWAMGQILYIVVAGGIYFLVLMGASVFILLPEATFATDGWGKIVNTLAQTNAGAQIGLQFGISPKITDYYSPFGAFVLSFLLNWGVAVLLGLLMFWLNLKFSRMTGLVAAAAVLFWDLLVINNFPYDFYYFSPVTVSRLATVDPAGFTMLPDLSYPFILYGIGIVLLTFLIIAGIRNEPVEITAEI